MKILLTTDRLALRRFAASDLNHLFALDNDADVMRFINGGTPTPREVIEGEILPGFMAHDAERPEFGFWAVEAKETGKRLICMASPDGGMTMWTTGEYREIDPTTRLVYTESMSDADGNVISPAAMGMPEGHPETTEVTVLLADLGGRTKMVMTHAGMPADSGAAGGWNQAFDKLADHVESAVNEE